MKKMGKMFRLLRADEIECRVQKCNANGVSLLLYKDARCDQNILDETVGPLNWQRDHKELKGVIYGGVGINANFEDMTKPPLWIWKWDAGAESYTEKEKGESSDSFKRACVNAGIGRELYTAPCIWIKGAKTEQKDGKWVCKEFFNVSDIAYENGKIDYLLIRNRQGEIVFQKGSSDRSPRARLIQYCKDNGLKMQEIAERYHLDKDSSELMVSKVLKALSDLGSECNG